MTDNTNLPKESSYNQEEFANKCIYENEVLIKGDFISCLGELNTTSANLVGAACC